MRSYAGTALPIYLSEAVHAPAWILSPALLLNSLLVIGSQTLGVRLLEQHRRTRAIGAAALVWCLSCSLFVFALIIPRSFLAPYLLLVVTLHTLASVLYTPQACALVADLGPGSQRGRYLATKAFVNALIREALHRKSEPGCFVLKRILRAF